MFRSLFAPKRHWIPLLAMVSALPLYSNTVMAAELIIHGETHDSAGCIKNRRHLAQATERDESLLFLENVFVDKDQDTYARRRSRGMLEDLFELKNVHGLELRESWLAGIFTRTYEDFNKSREAALKIEATDPDFTRRHQRFKHWDDARWQIRAFLQYGEILDTPDLKEMFATGVAYDDHFLSSLKPNEIGYYIENQGSAIMEQIRKNMEATIELVNKDLEIPSSPVNALQELKWVSLQGLQDSDESKRVILIWRNYVMAQLLERQLQLFNSRNAKTIHVVLGAAHVRHFYEILKRDHPLLAQAYTLRTDYDCLTVAEKKLYGLEW